ncbi:GAF domain-containing protein [Tengunoibacter tsumagoiensis]|uniref:GAF domain-containing protein n=1 Tax=Tengunoibacter tsumagoiensis TaxID=2014871 RepID=A0A402A5R5_9CHLR|nr:GAF domain-containing protein [Tengunoibacter tsumagoiensis]GCE14396.1 hypothetical protein KTT_42550 [Tengunoibacter tsumagoiensis]
MEEASTWRDLLGKIISDTSERQRIADLLGINPVTLIRWATGRSNPRQDNLRPLLDAIPTNRKRMIELIVQEFPHFLNSPISSDEKLPEISSAFYAHVLNVYTTSPHQLRSSSVSRIILQQILSHLDPQHLGLAIIIAKCVPPEKGQKVRSLRQTISRSNGPWEALEQHTAFLGAESQVGHAITTRHPVIVQSHQEKLRLFPHHHITQEGSIAVYPILMSDHAAGSLYIASTQPNYFTPGLLELIRSYTDLLVLSCTPQEFYDLNAIELGIMPRFEEQWPYLQTLQERITHQMILAAQQGQPLVRPDAEAIALHELENELLRLNLREQ